MMHAFSTQPAPPDVIAQLALTASGNLPEVDLFKAEMQGLCAQRRSRVCRSFAQWDTGWIGSTASACTREIINALGITHIGEVVTK